MPESALPVLAVGGILWAAVLTYHELRQEKLKQDVELSPSIDKRIDNLEQQLATTREIARELAEALEPFAKARATFKALHSHFTSKEYRAAGESFAKAKAAGILNAPEAPDSLPPTEVWWY